MCVYTLAFFFVVVLVVQKVVLVVLVVRQFLDNFSFPFGKIGKIGKIIFSSVTIVNTAFH
jgi:hypothetical protein